MRTVLPKYTAVCTMHAVINMQYNMIKSYQIEKIIHIEAFSFTSKQKLVTHRAQMGQEPFYVIHVYAVIFLKLVFVHPEREEGRERINRL